jgi:hypothetical protein
VHEVLGQAGASGRPSGWATNRLLDEEAYPYLIIDTRHERVSDGGVITSQADRR